MKNLKLTLIFFLMLFFSINTLGIINVGTTINGYTYEKVLEANPLIADGIMDDILSISCDSNIYYSATGGHGYALYRLSTSTLNRTQGMNVMDVVATSQTNKEQIVYSDCSDYIYTLAFTGVYYILRQYSFDSFDTNGTLTVKSTARLSNTNLNVSNQNTYGTRIIDSGNYIYLNSDYSLKKYDKDDITTLLDIYTDSSNLIIDVAFDGTNFFILTNSSLTKVNNNLNIISTTTSDVDLDFSIAAGINRAQFLQYNSYDNYLYLTRNPYNISVIDTDTLNELFKITLNDSLEYNNLDLRDIIYINDYLYYINNSHIMKKCNVYSSICEVLFDISDLENYTTDYEINTVYTPFGKSTAPTISNGLFFYPIEYGNFIYDIALISGFDSETGLLDTIDYKSLDLSNTSTTMQTPYIYVTINASHATNDDFLLYAIDCDNVETISYSENFLGLDKANETEGYDNNCNYSVTNSIDGIDTDVLRFSNLINNCTEDLNYTFSQVYNNKVAVNFVISHSIFQNYNLTLYDSYNSEILDLNFEVDTLKNLIITNLNTSEIIYNINIQRNLSFLGISPLFKPYGEIIDFTIYIDFTNKSFVIEAGLYEDTVSYYTNRFNINNLSINFNKYSFDPYFTNFEKSEILEFKILNKDLVTYSEDNTKTCVYSAPGTYNIKGYVTSIFNSNDYSIYKTKSVYIRASTIEDLGNVFDPLFNSDSGLGATFWKTILLIAFTLSALYGVGVYNDTISNKSFGLMWVEFLGIETFMLLVMSYWINFFSLFYFVLILFIDAMTITYYVLKMFGGGD